MRDHPFPLNALRLIPSILLAVIACVPTIADTDSMELPLASLKNQHPRLLVSASAFEDLRDRDWDPTGGRFWEFFQETGVRMLDQPPVKRELTGKRLLTESRKALKRIVTWSLLYRTEGNPEFRDRAIREIEAAIAFSDWNPSHFLDVGEMALAVAIGADWLWEDLSDDQRQRVLAALKEKAILPSLDEDHPGNWWIYYYNNWNPVCHAGLVASALMLAETEPDLAKQIIRRAIKALPAAMEAYHPAGAYPEGPIYWDYGTSFTAILLDLLDNAFSTTFGLDEDPAFKASGTFRAVAVTPTGKFYNYADCGESAGLSEACAWFASHYGDDAARFELVRGLKVFLENSDWDPAARGGRLLPFAALWYPDNPSGKPDLPLVWNGRGPNPVAFVHESWGDPNGFFLGFKGGDGSVSHAHMDAGSFILEDEGVRWAIDLGVQNYNSLEQYGLGMWDRRQHADRWRIFRIGPFSHNILLIDQRPQDATTKADITKLAADEDGTIHGVVDLSPVTVGQAESVERHFHVYDHRVLRIVDEVRGARERTESQGRSPATLRWRMLTRAVVEIHDNRAILRQDGKAMHLVVEKPERINLRAEPVDPPPYFWDAPNPGVTAIDIWTKADFDGNQSISVIMSTDEDALLRQSGTR
jgi:hypothetical protein